MLAGHRTQPAVVQNVEPPSDLLVLAGIEHCMTVVAGCGTLTVSTCWHSTA